jgi:hypothetical protein
MATSNLGLNKMMSPKDEKLAEVINNLPAPIRSVLREFETSTDKVMALYAVTGLTSALAPHVWVNYGDTKNFMPLMVLIAFPPGSGKGKLALLVKLVRGIVKEQMEENSLLRRKYIQQKHLYDKSLKSGTPIDPPKKPAYPLLLIPGNITASKLTEQLDENNGNMVVLIFESEIHALTNMMGNAQFGKDTSMMLRKVFHTEGISIMRKGGDHYDIENPKLALVLTGTHSQIPSLFNTNKDGLISRFLVVMGDAPLIWKDVQPCETCEPANAHFDKLSSVYYSLYKHFKNRTVEFKLQQEHWDIINEFGKTRLQESFEQAGENATSIAKRHALMIARIAGVFSMVRYFETKCEDEIYYCNDLDFQSALWMAEESYECSLRMLESLPGEKSVDGERLEEFFGMLPSFFQRRELSPLEKSLNISNSTMSRLLKKLVDAGRLASPKKGVYEKIEVTYLTDDRS